MLVTHLETLSRPESTAGPRGRPEHLRWHPLRKQQGAKVYKMKASEGLRNNCLRYGSTYITFNQEAFIKRHNPRNSDSVGAE